MSGGYGRGLGGFGCCRCRWNPAQGVLKAWFSRYQHLGSEIDAVSLKPHPPFFFW